MRKIKNILIKLAQSALILLLLLVLHLALLYYTNAYWRGMAAVMAAIGLAGLLFYLLHRRGWTSTKYNRIILSVPFLLFCAFIAYTLIPVASSGNRKRAPDFALVTTKYWNLNTGSRIAYYKLPAKKGIQKKETPIIFLHGGPGAYVRKLEIDFFNQFTNDGYDVYLYDQAGSGRSDLLSKATYSHERNIDDFEAIINTISAKQYIVIGQSYGGALLAHITARKDLYKRIAKAIYAEPGVSVTNNISEGEKVFAKSPHATAGDINLPVRLLISMMITPKGEFTSQNEIINYLLDHKQLIQGLFSESYPGKDVARIPAVDISVINFAANAAIKTDDTKPSGELADNYRRFKVPSMLIIGESSYVERNAPMDLLRINPNITRVQYVKGVGHILWNGLGSNNERIKRVIDQFLYDKNPDIPNYPVHGMADEFLKQRL